MWIYRSLLALVGGSCLVVLSATLTRTVASVGPASAALSPILAPSSVPPAPAPQADAEAERCLDQVLDAFKPERVNWLEMDLWQKVQLPGCVYEADGFYRLAPRQRFRMELHTHPAGAEGTMLSVSDGHALWQAERSGQGAWENVSRINLSEVFAAMNGPARPQLREEFLQRPHFQGMLPLLRNLRCQLIWARSEMIRQASGDRIRLVGVWPNLLGSLAPDQPWPVGLPRQCHVHLDARTYWPQRIEWWGPTKAGGEDSLLVQMEFRNPVFNRQLSDATCARLFAFQPGAAEVDDETASVAAEMSRRASELTPTTAAR